MLSPIYMSSRYRLEEELDRTRVLSISFRLGLAEARMTRLLVSFWMAGVLSAVASTALCCGAMEPVARLVEY